MRSKLPVGLLFFVSVIYIGFGDQFLPESIGRYSFQARSSIDQMLINAFPQWQPKTNPYRRTEDAIQNK